MLLLFSHYSCLGHIVASIARHQCGQTCYRIIFVASKGCVCNGKYLEFKGESVFVMRDPLPRFPQICLYNGNEFFSEHGSASVLGLGCPQNKGLSVIIWILQYPFRERVSFNSPFLIVYCLVVGDGVQQHAFSLLQIASCPHLLQALPQAFSKTK